MDATADVPQRSYAFGLERAGYVGLAWPRLTLVLALLVSALAAWGMTKLRVDDSLSELFRTDTEEFRRYEEIDRIPYLAPALVGAEKAARGKTPTDVWWHTIVSPTSREKTGYATQKPLGVVERIVRVHSNPGDLVVDFFAGSGTLGEAAAKHGRDFLLVDDNPEAIAVMARRLSPYGVELERRE